MLVTVLSLAAGALLGAAVNEFRWRRVRAAVLQTMLDTIQEAHTLQAQLRSKVAPSMPGP